MRKLPRVTASGIIIACTLLTAAIPIGVVVPSLVVSSRSIVEAEAAGRLESVARGAGDQLARALNVQWRELKALGEFARAQDPAETLRIRLDAIKATNPRYAWIGLADAGGRVVTATGHLLEGQSVAERPWFKGGTDGPFAGDLHQALLLKSEPARLIDFATPIRRNGEAAGVLGAHITWDWLADFIRQVGNDSGVELILVDRDGTVLVGAGRLEGRRLTTHSASAARLGTASTSIETWEDGSDHLVSVIPTIGLGDLPSFGWSLIASIPAEAAFAPAGCLTATLLSALFFSAIAVCLGAILLGRIVGRPVARMAAAAASAASNRFDQPVPDERAFREVAELSASLSRLQSKVQALDEAAAEEPRPLRAAEILVRTAA